ncbi:sterigmatocystin 8-O-methyltransferase [Durotheca rogersii]|uniref:sterigmatocystin 8-O-methyltransferase n=1 Tax=Durotheca rogersii TaxID=419775 RepID=UPI0022203825|nr:sterigmatocystin 8-O-methyltransferase [Durotheca rogersii]KAI5865369.1 sterigmatocystin 8-O-methyltransferase [Durotheca rogersii]
MVDFHLALGLIERLSHLSSRLSLSSEDSEERKEALQLSKQITAALEKPKDVAVALMFSPTIPATIRAGVYLDLYRYIVEHGAPISSAELAVLSGGEELLIIRILRVASSIGVVTEVDERQWEANPVTRSMIEEGVAAGHRMIGEIVMGAAQKMPRFLQESGFRCPTDPRHGPLQHAFQTKLSAFAFLATAPGALSDFNRFMGNTMGARRYWVNWFPVPQRVLDGAGAAQAGAPLPLVVDVAGGHGHDLLAFHQKYPGRARLVLQDTSSVLNSVRHPSPFIEHVAYNFFEPQPLKGARVYFYHHILHDWPDGKCAKILAQAKAAMKPGYSKLLLHEMIVPERGASTFHAMIDITMLVFNSGIERTERQWRKLLAAAGFEVLKVWLPPEEDADGIVEAVLKE